MALFQTMMWRSFVAGVIILSGLVLFGSRAVRAQARLNKAYVVNVHLGATDPCTGVALGSAISSGPICAGTFGGVSYMITPGGCTDTVCSGAGGTDSVQMHYEDVTVDTGATSNNDGRYNTKKIIKADSSAPAALFCTSMNYGGYKDWFLPSLNELYYFYTKKTSLSGFQTIYRSSTQYDSSNAWSQSFSDGSQTYYPKGWGEYIRCARRY